MSNHRKGVARQLAFLPILGRVICCMHCFKASKAYLFLSLHVYSNCNGFVYIAPRWLSSSARASTFLEE